MIIDFDPNKSARNAKDRGLPFSVVEQFDWEDALLAEDDRFAYPERRFVAPGRIGKRVHVVCFTPIEGGIRVISLRKANSREVRRYDNATHE
ncbi:BrnT family toxin [Halomonas dongshanensis]|uniref:BrnT family toxin n=1 Tax=Halomonas dongshanensis TaxID=2890835 RepID=A0ABT2EBZ4_9GAMM|nr:BrnT family toxin [Halomonas dongshanensis]MCS2609102.1 BrnT family toxin [Halomonas dongshanensis]